MRSKQKSQSVLICLLCIINLYFTDLNSQTTSFTPTQLYRIQNSYAYIDMGSSNAPYTVTQVNPITGLPQTVTVYPAGPLNFYEFKTDRQGFSFEKNLISAPGLFSSLGPSMSFNFITTPLHGAFTLVPAVIITKTDGKFGIGHTAPTTITAKFDLINTQNKLSFLTTSNFTSDNLNANIFKVNRDKTKAIAIFNTNYLNSGQTRETFVVMGNGATHIGEKWGNGVYKDALLSVYGQVVARSFHVTIDGANWADYVFKSDYPLMPLNEVEAYYETNHHLPEVPSAADLDAKGLDIAGMESILLKKIEELTLYIVKQQKEIDVMKHQLKEFQK